MRGSLLYIRYVDAEYLRRRRLTRNKTDELMRTSREFIPKVNRHYHAHTDPVAYPSSLNGRSSVEAY